MNRQPPHSFRSPHDLIDPPKAAGDYDAIADLFLSDTPASTHAQSHAGMRIAQRPQPTTELLIAGHLPVLSGAWVVQYASRLARDTQRVVALAQVGTEGTSIQLLFPTDPDGRPGRATSLINAIRLAQQSDPMWLIAADDHSLSDLLSHPSVNAACLLTAPNEAATVAAYQTLKDIASHLARNGRDERFRLRVALAGASEADAERALDRIDRAASAFMHRRVELAATIARVAPTIAAVVYDAPTRHDPLEIVELLATPTLAEHPPGRDGPDHSDAHPRPTPASPAGRSHERAALQMPADERRPTAPADEQVAPRSVPLAAHLHLRSTPMRCPDAPGVEIAIDDTGTLHALRQAVPDSPDSAISELLAVESWLSRQASLVNLALQRETATPITVQQHLFVPDARVARPLLDSPVRIHLLCTRRAQGREITLCEPLN